MNIKEMEAIFNEQERIMTLGTEEEIIQFAQEFNIHQESNNKNYLDKVARIRTRLEYFGIDPDTL